jgi:hypothetical protein
LFNDYIFAAQDENSEKFDISTSADFYVDFIFAEPLFIGFTLSLDSFTDLRPEQ